MTTLSTVAREAGVSISTVSRVLNQKSGVVPIAERTRERIQRIARELSYVPSGAARALCTGRSRTFGVLGSSPQFFFPDQASGASFTAEAMRGLLGVAVEIGYHVTLLTGEESRTGAGGVMVDIGMADGVLVLNRDLHKETRYVSSVAACPKPVVYVSDYPDNPKAYACAPDDIQGGRLATQMLLDAGHRQIGFVRMACYPAIFDRREQGWREALLAAGIGPRPEWVFESPDFDLARFEAADPTAAVCANDQIAASLRDCLQKLGKAMPPDFAVVAFGHAARGAQRKQEFAMVVQPLAEIVTEGVRRLVALIEGKDCRPKKRLFEHTFRPGASFEAVGGRD